MRDEWKEKLRKVKLIITIIIIAGVIIHLFLVYEAAKSLEITGKKITGLYPTYRKIDEYEVKFALTFKNPKSTPIEVEYLHYKVYIEKSTENSRIAAEAARDSVKGTNYLVCATFLLVVVTAATTIPQLWKNCKDYQKKHGKMILNLFFRHRKKGS